jgi:hypothetical protein
VSIIDPDGLFNGDRLRKCSNAARLYWPYLFLVSNGFGRFEVNYSKIVARAFSGFSPVPSQHEIERLILEYKSNYLLFLYPSPDGNLWGQWDTRQTLLKKHKTASDKRSPAPDPAEFENWREEYRKLKSRPVSSEFRQILGFFSKNDDFSAKKQDLEPMLENLPLGGGVGEGIGVGGGKGEEQSAPEIPNPNSPEFTRPPDGMETHQYARVALDNLHVPITNTLLDLAAQSVGLVSSVEKVSLAEATWRVMCRARDDQTRGELINRFWFEDQWYSAKKSAQRASGQSDGKTRFDNRTKAQRDQDATIDAVAGAKEIFRRMVDRTAGNPGGEQGRAANTGASGG